MKICRSFVALFALLLFGSSAGSLSAETLSIEVMGGSAFNFATPLYIHQDGYPDLHINASYDTKPFGPYAPYYSWRAGLWDKDEAWEISQVHHRIYLSNPPPEVQFFAIHFGYNYFFFGHAWNKAGFHYHLGIGPIIANPETTVRGQQLFTGGMGLFDAGYDFSGIGAEVSITRNIDLNPNLYLVLEAAFIAGWAWWIPVAGGYADVPSMALHYHLGTGYRF